MRRALLPKHTELMYALLRIVVGLMFAMHGAQKFGLFGGPGIEGFATGVGIPIWLSFLVGVFELGGGLMVALGLWSHYGALAGAIVMLTAIIKVHSSSWNPLVSKGELAILYLVAFLVVMAYGSGKYGLDSQL